MKLKNELTGDTLELPPPNELGESCVLFNGKVVASVLYSDETNSVTLGDGRIFSIEEWPQFVVKNLKDGWVKA